MSLRQIILGSPLPTTGYAHQRLSKVKALAVFSSDALSSVAYATEEILLVLVTAGMVALELSMPIALVITGLLVIVAASYYQTIHGYPSGGGAYIVAHDNLGVWHGLIAAAALLIDYVLTVAVSITAGIVAIDPQATARVEENWQAWNLKVPLVVLKSPYHSAVRPLLTYLEETDQRGPERGLAVVILPEIVPACWWQNLLHNQTTLLIKAVLLFRQERGGAARVVINVPYHLHG